MKGDENFKCIATIDKQDICKKRQCNLWTSGKSKCLIIMVREGKKEKNYV